MIYKDYFTPLVIEEDHLEHHGVLGMKWGVRRYQNADGTLTAKGKTRYQKDLEKTDSAIKRERSDVRFLKKMWADEGWGKKDIDLGLEEYEQNIQRMENKRREIETILKQGRVSNAKTDAMQRRIESAKAKGKAYADKKRSAIQKDIDSFKPFIKTGLLDKKGRMLLTPEDIQESIRGLELVRDKI